MSDDRSDEGGAAADDATPGLAPAPVLAVVRAAGLHWNYAFTIVNIALLAVFAWCAVSTLGTSAA